MSNDNTGGPAFPCPLSADPHLMQAAYIEPNEKGMTLRDYFAAKAMQGIIANNGLVDCKSNGNPIEYTYDDSFRDAKQSLPDETPDLSFLGEAVIAYDVADAMLFVRNHYKGELEAMNTALANARRIKPQ